MGELIITVVVIVGGVLLLHLLTVFVFFGSRHSAIDPPPQPTIRPRGAPTRNIRRKTTAHDRRTL
jgi:hypothetical protein